jgi:hypothetical protein
VVREAAVALAVVLLEVAVEVSPVEHGLVQALLWVVVALDRVQVLRSELVEELDLERESELVVQLDLVQLDLAEERGLEPESGSAVLLELEEELGREPVWELAVLPEWAVELDRERGPQQLGKVRRRIDSTRRAEAISTVSLAYHQMKVMQVWLRLVRARLALGLVTSASAVISESAVAGLDMVQVWAGQRAVSAFCRVQVQGLLARDSLA